MTETLEEQAARLYPDSIDLQRKWMNAVGTLRAGRGWTNDGVVGYSLPLAAPPATPRFADNVVPVLRGKRK